MPPPLLCAVPSTWHPPPPARRAQRASRARSATQARGCRYRRCGRALPRSWLQPHCPLAGPSAVHATSCRRRPQPLFPPRRHRRAPEGPHHRRDPLRLCQRPGAGAVARRGCPACQAARRSARKRPLAAAGPHLTLDDAAPGLSCTRCSCRPTSMCTPRPTRPARSAGSWSARGRRAEPPSLGPRPRVARAAGGSHAGRHARLAVKEGIQGPCTAGAQEQLEGSPVLGGPPACENDGPHRASCVAPLVHFSWHMVIGL